MKLKKRRMDVSKPPPLAYSLHTCENVENHPVSKALKRLREKCQIIPFKINAKNMAAEPTRHMNNS
jgi:hypothetical protein